MRKGARKLWEQNWFQRVMTFWNPLVSMPNWPVYYLRHRRSVMNLWRVRRFCIIVINDGMCEGFLVFFQLYLLGEYPEEQLKATEHNENLHVRSPFVRLFRRSFQIESIRRNIKGSNFCDMIFQCSYFFWTEWLMID